MNRGHVARKPRRMVTVLLMLSGSTTDARIARSARALWTWGAGALRSVVVMVSAGGHTLMNSPAAEIRGADTVIAPTSQTKQPLSCQRQWAGLRCASALVFTKVPFSNAVRKFPEVAPSASTSTVRFGVRKAAPSTGERISTSSGRVTEPPPSSSCAAANAHSARRAPLARRKISAPRTTAPSGAV